MSEAAKKPAAPKAPVLAGKDKRFLRALGHALDPIVQIGKAGLTDAVKGAVDIALGDEARSKARQLTECAEDRDDAAEQLAKALSAGVAQTLGRTILLYRPHPKKPRIRLPKEGDSAKDALVADRRAKAKAEKRREAAKRAAASPERPRRAKPAPKRGAFGGNGGRRG